jgi:hypothetical protein
MPGIRVAMLEGEGGGWLKMLEGDGWLCQGFGWLCWREREGVAKNVVGRWVAMLEGVGWLCWLGRWVAMLEGDG